MQLQGASGRPACRGAEQMEGIKYRVDDANELYTGAGNRGLDCSSEEAQSRAGRNLPGALEDARNLRKSPPRPLRSQHDEEPLPAEKARVPAIRLHLPPDLKFPVEQSGLRRPQSHAEQADQSHPLPPECSVIPMSRPSA